VKQAVKSVKGWAVVNRVGVIIINTIRLTEDGADSLKMFKEDAVIPVRITPISKKERKP
jgi:hypothetical protein